MTRAERLAVLGPDAVAWIHQRVAEAPAPDATAVAALQPLLSAPARRLVKSTPAPAAPRTAA
ncbi:hypothetical protein LG634_24915 [Streptomyces bambusae]|uniref:hypothetical protein n=1 Tax=Streptomyces bambusae TaxID=1550616 RepID=UPI001CFE754B|nr:hypothetical protein [Streptomyces bambusae]MCB5168056.1 hypothetical protein [Streptomyces bambusae]